MIWLAILAQLLLVVAAFGWAQYVAERARRSGALVAHNAEVDALKRVGAWYEGRVAELEQETRELAFQVLSAGGQAVMPSARAEIDPYEGKEFAYDETGLVREVLDPRDLPFVQR